MTRLEQIKNMDAKQIAKIIIENNITDEFCKSDCEGDEDENFECLHELDCCKKWLNEEESNESRSN